MQFTNFPMGANEEKSDSVSKRCKYFFLKDVVSNSGEMQLILIPRTSNTYVLGMRLINKTVLATCHGPKSPITSESFLKKHEEEQKSSYLSVHLNCIMLKGFYGT